MGGVPRAIALCVLVAACGSDDGPGGGGGGGGVPLPSPSCAAAGGSSTVAEPQLVAELSDRYHEGWLASPGIADLDGDGTAEIVAPRAGMVSVWHIDEQLVWQDEVDGRVWAPPVIADLDPDVAGLEVAVSVRDSIIIYDAAGQRLPGFPVRWQDELRSLAAGDIDADGALELVAVTTSPLDGSGQRDIVIAIEVDGSIVSGFPANTTGASGCDDACYVTGGYDQNVALGDVDGDGALDILAPQDNAYVSLHAGTGRAFDAASIFEDPTKFMGIRMLHDLALARQGYGPDDADQAHFTNTAPAIADVDGDGVGDLVMLASVQNIAQNDRERGVALWVLRPDGTRLAGWDTPAHFPDFLSGLWDFEDNVVAATNQVSVATLDPERPAPQFVFAGFDGRIHAVDAAAGELWSVPYTTDDRVLTGGVAVADLSGDGAPEIVFATYSPDPGKGELLIYDAGGNRLHSVVLPTRGGMPVPTIADADGDGQLEIAVSLKGGEDREPQVLVYTVDGSAENCLLWPTGRGNLRRDGYVPPAE